MRTESPEHIFKCVQVNVVLKYLGLQQYIATNNINDNIND